MVEIPLRQESRKERRFLLDLYPFLRREGENSWLAEIGWEVCRWEALFRRQAGAAMEVVKASQQEQEGVRW